MFCGRSAERCSPQRVHSRKEIRIGKRIAPSACLLSLPANLLEYPSQTRTLCLIDRFHECDSAVQVLHIVRVGNPILGVVGEADAVSKYCLEAIEVAAYDIHMLVRNQTCQMLPHTLSH